VATPFVRSEVIVMYRSRLALRVVISITVIVLAKKGDLAFIGLKFDGSDCSFSK
jgi:hypothetical protein